MEARRLLTALAPRNRREFIRLWPMRPAQGESVFLGGDVAPAFNNKRTFRTEGSFEGYKFMNHWKIAFLTVSVSLAMLTTGCATVTGGTTQKVSVKTQKDAVDVAGADCVLSNSRGTYKVTTPGKVSVHRAEDDLNIKCTKDGEAEATTTAKSSTRKGAYYAGNLIMFGIVGGALITGPIDRATGAKYAYPDDIIVPFGKDADSDAANTGAVQSTQAQAQTASTTDTAPSMPK